MCNKYNGHENYPTWVTALWIDNDQGLNEMVADEAERIVRDNDGKNAEARTEMEEYLKALLDEITTVDTGDASLTVDLFTWATGMIDFRELAVGYLEEVEIETDEEETEETE